MEYERKGRLSERARAFKALGHPVRLQIVQALVQGGEACVCHLEHHLGLRQAYLSQHLAKLRSAGLVTDRRSGSNVYYELGDEWVPFLLTVVRETGIPSAGQRHPAGRSRARREPCPCPRCGESEAPAVARAPRGAPA